MIRPGIFAKTFARPTLEESLDAVIAHGVDAIQFNLALLGGPSLPARITPRDAERVRGAVAARELEMAAVSGTYNMAHPDPVVRADGRARLRALIEAAPVLGAPIVTVCTGTRDPDDMWRGHPDNATGDAWRDMLECLGEAAATAERHRIVLGIEPEPNNVVRDAEAARRLLDELRSPSLGIVVDAANLVSGGAIAAQKRTLDEAFALLGDDIVLAHAKDVAADGTVVAAGRGELDYEPYVTLLDHAGYAGPLVLHGLGEDDVPRAVAFLRRAIARVDPRAQIGRGAGSGGSGEGSGVGAGGAGSGLGGSGGPGVGNGG
jgi:sugar phosphate isomerase/epimerase